MGMGMAGPSGDRRDAAAVAVAVATAPPHPKSKRGDVGGSSGSAIRRPARDTDAHRADAEVRELLAVRARELLDLQPADDLGEQDPEGEDVDLGPGRIAASETEAANMLAKLV